MRREGWKYQMRLSQNDLFHSDNFEKNNMLMHSIFVWGINYKNDPRVILSSAFILFPRKMVLNHYYRDPLELHVTSYVYISIALRNLCWLVLSGSGKKIGKYLPKKN